MTVLFISFCLSYKWSVLHAGCFGLILAILNVLLKLLTELLPSSLEWGGGFSFWVLIANCYIMDVIACVTVCMV